MVTVVPFVWSFVPIQRDCIEIFLPFKNCPFISKNALNVSSSVLKMMIAVPSGSDVFGCVNKIVSVGLIPASEKNFRMSVWLTVNGKLFKKSILPNRFVKSTPLHFSFLSHSSSVDYFCKEKLISVSLRDLTDVVRALNSPKRKKKSVDASEFYLNLQKALLFHVLQKWMNCLCKSPKPVSIVFHQGVRLKIRL